MRGPYKPRSRKSPLTLRQVRAAAHDAECAAEDAGILLARAALALEPDQLDLRLRARALLVAACDRLTHAVRSLDARLVGGAGAKRDALVIAMRATSSLVVSQTGPSGVRSPSSSKTEGARLTAPASATRGGAA